MNTPTIAELAEIGITISARRETSKKGTVLVVAVEIDQNALLQKSLPLLLQQAQAATAPKAPRKPRKKKGEAGQQGALPLGTHVGTGTT